MIIMGIRINKKLGFGLDLREVSKICQPDMSWNNDFYDYMENAVLWEKFKEEMLQLKTSDGFKGPSDVFFENYSLEENREKQNFYNFVTYDDEFGDKNLILFQPITSSKDWSRYNDSIDYVEESIKPSAIPNFTQFNNTLYPYIKLMQPNPEAFMGIETYWVSCYKDRPEYKDAVPFCTYGVMMMLKYMNLVPEDKLVDTIMLIRPTIYTYWS
jgi:hypothetical protein